VNGTAKISKNGTVSSD